MKILQRPKPSLIDNHLRPPKRLKKYKPVSRRESQRHTKLENFHHFLSSHKNRPQFPVMTRLLTSSGAVLYNSGAVFRIPAPFLSSRPPPL
jgi:hypothetical protein